MVYFDDEKIDRMLAIKVSTRDARGIVLLYLDGLTKKLCLYQKLLFFASLHKHKSQIK